MSVAASETRREREKQSRRQFAWTAAFSMSIQLYAAGTGLVLTRAFSAAWWVTVISFIPALAMFFPIWKLLKDMNGEKWTQRMRNTLGKGGAKVFFLLLGAAFLLDAACAVKLLSMLVRQYVISGGAQTLLSLCTAAVLGWAAAKYGAQSLSRLTWLIRFFLLMILAVGVAAILPGSQGSCLYPVLGESVEKTLGSLPLAAGAYAGAAALPLFREEEGREAMRFWEGAYPMAAAAVLAGCLMLLNQLSISPQMISDSIFWARRLLLGAETVEKGYILQVLFLIGLMGVLMISASFSMLTASGCLAGAYEKKQGGGAVMACVLILAVFSLGTGEKFTKGLWQVMEARYGYLLLLFYGAWIWGGIRKRILARRGGNE